ncbi:hypothetical protein BH23ACT9_BH23ACT9_26860 [soil metagenome]
MASPTVVSVTHAPPLPADSSPEWFEPYRDDHGVLMLRPETEPVPESDAHVRLVDLLHAGFAWRHRDDEDVTVHCRLAWFPDEADTTRRLDPDVMVVHGRPKQQRTSYRAWAEAHVVPSLIIEVASSNDTESRYRQRLDQMFDDGVAEVVLVQPYAPGGVQVIGYVADPTVPAGYRVRGFSAGVDATVEVDDGVVLCGGADLQVHDEHGSWLDVPGIREAAARAEAESARADRLAAALTAAGIDPDAV